tara:strand:- start:351 stop:668 length:318 start_codon:yes stop_codon:yes gene_type:complete
MSGNPIDLFSLDGEDMSKIVHAIHTVAGYNDESKEVRDSIKETLDDLVANLGANKTSAAEIKRVVKKVARIRADKKDQDFAYENQIIENLLEQMDKASVDPEDNE